MIVNIKKRYAYGIMGLLVLAVGVFVVNALTPGVAPNPGHLITEVAPPSGCGDGQVLQFIDEDNGWGCVDLPVDTDTDDQTLSIAGQSLSISEGNSVTLPGGVSEVTSYSRSNCYTINSGAGGGWNTVWCADGYFLAAMQISTADVWSGRCCKVESR